MNTTLKTSYNLSLLSILIGLSAIIGWYFHLSTLYTFLSHGASMKFNTAFTILLLGVSIALGVRNKPAIAGIIGTFIIVFCLMTLAEYLYETDLHIDQLLVIDDLTDSQNEPPGRMSLFTTISIFVITLGMGLTQLKKYFIAQIVTAIGLLVTYISFVGVLFNISGLFSFGPYSAIALPTALSLISASAAVLLSSADKGWLSEMATKHSAAITTRYSLLYFFLSLPIFIGLFLLMLTKAQLPAELAIVVLIVGFATLTLPFAFILLRKLNRSDEKSLGLTEELKIRSQQLYDNNEELSRKNRELDSLIHIISHDLKTPIAALKGSLSILERKLAGQLQEKDLQLLAIPQRSVKRLNETIVHLNELIKNQEVESGNFEDVDLCLLVNEVILELHNFIQETGAAINIDIVDCEVSFDRIHLHSIMQNLITNALKFRHPLRPPVIEVSAKKIKGGIEIKVADNGLGIPEQQKEHLFSKYMRFHEQIEGTGVGLHLIKQIIEDHGGSIDAVSEEGQGTIFTVTLRSK
ncbi:hypothetical protein INP83_13075 [Mucilaginibacter sp. 21P]|uniref:sensor histidine kinase n=1 Tax=Mucilaginibacter sp. 21P TaxID=2778902 RepID=UPI001C56FCF6|nr:ATP-binding protein [Mucilaginibacter sp. 21P]QXV64027.1 hypothetical protein INP83_13075 [Mucilaginibacter sp. 21P]